MKGPLVLCTHPLPTNLVVIEIELSNRSVVDVRRDFLEHFEDESILYVVAIKALVGSSKSQHCRRLNSPHVARDLCRRHPVHTRRCRSVGPPARRRKYRTSLPITQEMRQMFATEEAGLLPAVEATYPSRPTTRTYPRPTLRGST
jgi:hypothetical protein